MKKSLIIVGPALSVSGYGEQTRFAVSSLKKSNKYEIYLHNTDWGKTTWLSHNAPERKYIDSLISKTSKLKEDFRADISLQVSMPHEFKIYSRVNIGYTAGTETDRVEDDWITASNMMDGIIVPSVHSKNSFTNRRGRKHFIDSDPKVVGFPCTLNKESKPSPRLSQALGQINGEHNFLAFAQVSPRKNIFNLIKWFLQEFSQDNKKTLTLKVHGKNLSTIDFFETREKISSFINQLFPKKRCQINIIHGLMSHDEISCLFESGKFTHFLSTSYGEGFGIPLFNAAASGLVIVAPLWSGPVDYLKKDTIVEVPHSLDTVPDSCVWDGIITKNARWAHIEGEKYRDCLNRAVKDYDNLKKRAKIASRQLRKKYTFQKQSFMFNHAIEEIIKREKGVTKNARKTK